MREGPLGESGTFGQKIKLAGGRYRKKGARDGVPLFSSSASNASSLPRYFIDQTQSKTLGAALMKSVSWDREQGPEEWKTGLERQTGDVYLAPLTLRTERSG